MSGRATLLSIVVASRVPLRDAQESLGTIARQSSGRPVEIIVACPLDGDAPGEAECPHATIVRVRPPAHLPRLLAAGIAVAKGDVIAITDAACAFDEGWVAAILTAHEEPHPVIGGAVEPRGLRTRVDWAAYFCDYGQFMLSLKEGVAGELPGNNLSLKRSMLACGKELVDGEFWKTYWCRRLQAEGVHLYAVPSIVVYYRKSYALGAYLVHRFHNGRCFAGMRIAQTTWLGRMAYMVGSPALPVLLCARIVRAVVPKRRRLREFLLSYPIIVLATVAWAAGELCGYVAGPGGSCQHVR